MDYIRQWDYIRTKIGISSDKRVPVRISRRSLAQSIREGHENATPLGTKFFKKYKNFFYDPLYIQYLIELPIYIRC